MHLSECLKKTACAAVAAAFMLTGCSTPQNAGTVGDKTYTTGEYLACLFMNFNQVYNQSGLAYYAQYGMDPWAQEFPYGEGDDAENLSTEDYIVRLTQDTLVRMKAMEDKMEEYGFSWSDEDKKESETAIAETLKSFTSDQMLKLGFSKQSYTNIYLPYTLNERTVFYGLYDKGGQREMSDQEIREYFDNNFLSYKIIELSLADSEGNALPDDEIKEAKDRLEKYLGIYNETGDFDKAIEQNTADNQASTTTTTTGTGTTTTAPTTATTTTAPTTTTTTTTTTGTETGTTAADDDSSDEEETDPNLRNIDANGYSDQKLVDAIKSVPEGEAKIVEYKKNDKVNTAALILRFDPEGEQNPENYFEDSRESILYGAHHEEFNEEIEEYIKTLTVNFDKAVTKKCTPKKMEEDMKNL